MLKKKGDYVGRVLAGRPGLADPGRLALVGVKVVDAGQKLRAGAHLTASAEAKESLGFVTAACPTTQGEGFIGLALLRGGRERIGQRLHAADPVRGQACDVTIVSPHFVDPDNLRVKDASPAGAVEPLVLPRSVPGHHALIPDRPSDRVAEVQLAERSPDMAGIKLRRDGEAGLRRTLQAEFGLNLPEPGQSTVAGALKMVSTGPGDWLVLDKHGRPGSLAVSLKHALGESASVVDLSSAFGVLRLSGAQARSALMKLCRIDLHPRVFGPGHVARTLMAQIPILLHQVSDEPAYDLFAPSTLAQAFAETLVESAAEYGVKLD
jgi:heterotetrameric sarcosine oxidase gamma subunit